MPFCFLVLFLNFQIKKKNFSMKIDKYSITATARVHHIYSYVNYGELGSYISNQIVYTGANNKILCLIADKVHLSLLRVTKYFYQNLQHIIFMVCRLEHVPSWRWWKCIKVSQKSVICFRTGWIYQQISQSLYCNQIGSNSHHISLWRTELCNIIMASLQMT